MGSLAVVIVLGDIGRSPRMQQHALALAQHFGRVALLGYEGAEPMPELVACPAIELRALPPPRSLAQGAGVAELASTGLARGRDAARLLAALHGLGAPELVLAQNPPALPTSLLGLSAAARGARFVIDWHNFSHAMLALKLGPTHPVVRSLAALETGLGRRADAHLCVSQAMAAALRDRFDIPGAQVVYDRPLERTARPAEDRRLELLREVGALPTGGGREPALLVSPTSFTLDEDLELLVQAGARYRLAMQDDPTLPPLCIVVTGRGPGRERCEALFREHDSEQVRLRTAFLPMAAYRELLAVAELGVCLHHSASGLDLPMKVADMLGAGLPVCMLDYGPVVAEQVEAGRSALLFRTADQLAEQLVHVLCASGARELQQLREGAAAAGQRSWAQEWAARAQPVLLG